MIFQDAIVEFGFDCKVRKLSPRSIDNYQKQLRYLQNYLYPEYGVYYYCPEFALNALGDQAEEISRLVAQVMAERQEGQK